MEIKIKENKTTEFGLIPSDWQIKELQDVMTGFFSGATPYRGRPEYYKGQINWITSGELNYNIITDTIEKITEEAVRNTNLKILPKGTFLFAITGLEAEGTRGSCAITGIDATTNQSCMALFPFESLDVKYLYHYYVWKGKMLALRYCQGTKQQSYTGKIARKLPIILPPTKSEQTAIATALSDTDALIENLEKLIAKKRNIKHGVMQELLKPKSNWKRKRLGDTCEVFGRIGFRGYTIQDIVPEYEGAISLSPSNILDGELNFNKCTFISWKKYEESPEIKLKVGDIVLVKTASIGKTALVKSLPGKTTLNPQIVVLKNISVNNVFLSYLMGYKYIQDQIKEKVVGGVVPTLSQEQIAGFQIFLPSREEQDYIAYFLSLIDNDIETIKRNLNKYTMIKQGMMQSLLTGKIRLI